MQLIHFFNIVVGLVQFQVSGKTILEHGRLDIVEKFEK